MWKEQLTFSSINGMARNMTILYGGSRSRKLSFLTYHLMPRGRIWHIALIASGNQPQAPCAASTALPCAAHFSIASSANCLPWCPSCKPRIEPDAWDEHPGAGHPPGLRTRPFSSEARPGSACTAWTLRTRPTAGACCGWTRGRPRPRTKASTRSP